MRPHYETEADLANERDVIEQLCKLWSMRAEKLSPALYSVDYALYRGQGVSETLAGFVEVKCLTMPSTKHRCYTLSAAKIAKMRQLSQLFGVKAILVVAYTDRVMWGGVEEDNIERIASGGRRDRGDQFDREPCGYIPVANMKTVFLTAKEAHA